MGNVYLQEAFKALDMLTEEDFNINSTEDMSELKDFIENDDEDITSIDVIDSDATTEDELKDNYIGNIILDCEVCHTKQYRDPDDIKIDEETGLVDVGEECPYCYSIDGYTIIGEVAPYNSNKDKEDEDKIEIDDNIEESCNSKRNRKLREKKWSNTLKSGKALRKAIDSEDYDAIKEALINCYKEINELMPDAFDENDLESTLDDIEILDTEPDEDINVSMQDVEDNWNYELSDFYDLCDNLNIWISLNESYARINRSIKSLRENDASYSYKDSEKAIKSITKNFTKDSGSVITYFKDEKDHAKNILKKYYKYVDVSDGRRSDDEEMSWVIAYSTPNKNVKEDFERVEIETEDQKMEMTSEDSGKVIVTSEPKDTDKEEIIAPVSAEIQDEINPIEDEDVDEVDVDIDEFSEDEFDNLGESYLKKVYENVNSFKTSSVRSKGNSLIIEGIIKFNSGKNKKTSFVFEAKDITKRGKIRFIGENLQISRGKKSFTLSGELKGNKFISESLNYNYRAKDTNNISKRLYGTVKI